MRPCWMLQLLLLLGCTLLRAARPPVTCEDPQAASGAGVLVPCPNATGDEGNFSLLKGQRTVCTYEWRRQTDAQGEPCPGFDAKLHADENGKVVGFVVATAASQSAGTYKCKTAVTFPPPLQKFMGSPVTLLLVEGPQCDDRKNQSESAGAGAGEAEGGEGSLWAWMTAVALLATYSLIVTVLAVVSLRNTRSTDSYSDYMNTKPRERRRPQGIQMPIPRHF